VQLQQEINQLLPEGWDVMSVVVKDAPAPPQEAEKAGILPLCSLYGVEAGGLPIADAFHPESNCLATQINLVQITLILAPL
jgi:hypothetical protein